MSGDRLADLGERRLVRRVQEALASADGRLLVGPGDDAAVVRCRDRVVLTVDTQYEGTHFERDWLTAEDVGQRAMAVSLSDVAAMGAHPLCALVSLVLPADLSVSWLDGLLGGLRGAARDLDCPVAGGDVTRGRRIGVCVTAIGELAEGRVPVLRRGARPEDELLLAGHLGLAAAGRLAISASRDAEFPEAAAAYRRPRPLLGFAAAIAPRCHAMMDVSDGLAIDLARLCEASNVGARIEARALVSAQVRSAAAALQADAEDLALHGGDDYALLLAVPGGEVLHAEATALAHGTPVRRVGLATAALDLVLVTPAGEDRRLLPRGWDPFVEEGGLAEGGSP